MNTDYTNKAVFIDRDGTLIEDVGYLDSTKDVRFFNRAIEAIIKLNEAGYRVIVVSNQSGVARGYFEITKVDEIHKYISDELEKEHAYIDGYYFCPHNPKDNCSCRKPKTGMIIKAVEDFEIDENKSFIIGDKTSDVMLAPRTGMASILVLTGYGMQSLEEMKAEGLYFPDFIAADLWSAIHCVLSQKA